MSSEIIVVLIMIAIAIGGLVYLERHSRRNKPSDAEQSKPEERD